MRKYKEFEIGISSLKNGIHEFSYSLDDAFFSSFSAQDFSKSELKVQLQMDKKDRIFLLEFEITGHLLTNCDRCGDEFEMEIWDAFPLIVKRVEDPLQMETENTDPNIAYISKQEPVMNVAKWVYEFALLSIPMQRIHPNDEYGKSTCNQKALKLLADMETEKTKIKNPLWEGLEKFKTE